MNRPLRGPTTNATTRTDEITVVIDLRDDDPRPTGLSPVQLAPGPTNWDTEQGCWDMKLSHGAALTALWELDALVRLKTEAVKQRRFARIRMALGMVSRYEDPSPPLRA